MGRTKSEIPEGGIYGNNIMIVCLIVFWRKLILIIKIIFKNATLNMISNLNF